MDAAKALSRLRAQEHKLDQAIRALKILLDTDGTNGSSVNRRRKPMSLAERQAVSARMREYWARRRAQSVN